MLESVYVDLEKLLVGTVFIKKYIQHIVYEGLSSLCFSYGSLGHKRTNCHYTIQALVVTYEVSNGKEEAVQPTIST